MVAGVFVYRAVSLAVAVVAVTWGGALQGQLCRQDFTCLLQLGAQHIHLFLLVFPVLPPPQLPPPPLLLLLQVRGVRVYGDATEGVQGVQVREGERGVPR